MLNTKIDADDETLAEMLDGKKFTMDYFQREYRWERKHIGQLIDDLLHRPPFHPHPDFKKRTSRSARTFTNS